MTRIQLRPFCRRDWDTVFYKDPYDDVAETRIVDFFYDIDSDTKLNLWFINNDDIIASNAVRYHIEIDERTIWVGVL